MNVQIVLLMVRVVALITFDVSSYIYIFFFCYSGPTDYLQIMEKL